MLRNKKRGRQSFCSLSCASNYKHIKKEKINNIVCDFCFKEYYTTKSRLSNSKSGFHFCSRKCKDQAQQLKNGFTAIHPPHYGSGSSGYREIALRDLPNKCNRCGYDKCSGALEVHHKNRNRLFNDVSNLEILCANCHAEEHYINNDGQFSKRKGSLVKLAITPALQVGV